MSAKLLEETYPERVGWVDRSKLLDVQGRGRNRQLEMIKNYGWKYYEKPGGGCLLTDTSVAEKIKDPTEKKIFYDKLLKDCKLSAVDKEKHDKKLEKKKQKELKKELKKQKKEEDKKEIDDKNT